MYSVYILTNSIGTVLYIGVINNLTRRVYEHKIKFIDGFTKRYHVDKLVYCENFQRIEDAITVEKKIKGWTRKKKLALIFSFNPTWRDLGDEILR